MATLRPGTQVLVKTAPPPRNAPSDTGTWFVAGVTDTGPATVPRLCLSMDDFIRIFGGRYSYSSLMYDAVETFFREGGTRCWVGRTVGPGAVIASKNLLDSGAGVSLVVKALGPGAGGAPNAGNNLKVAVAAGSVGGTYVIQIYDSNSNLLEVSPNLTAQQDAVTWSANSNYVTVALGATALVPAVVAAASLTGGADDRTNITDTQRLAALNLFTKDLGPGQVSIPGQTTDTVHTMLADHTAANNRWALPDAPDTATTATLITSATNAKSTANGDYSHGLCWPWVLIPGVTSGTFRTVAPSAMVAGLTAQTDALYGAATPAAGALGESRFAVGLSQVPVTDIVRDQLNTAGVNVIRSMFGGAAIRNYGWRSLSDPVSKPNQVDAGVGRYLMSLTARAFNVGEQYVFAKIDGQGHLLSAYQGALTALCQTDWEAGDIYGLTTRDAFNVDTGPTVNTPTVLANNEIRANIAVRPSPDAELVTIQIVNVPITSEVS